MSPPPDGYFTPRPEQRTHCSGCGAARVAHAYGSHRCPTAWRPGTMAEAVRALTDAQRAADPARVFAARGEVQRLLGHRPGECAPPPALGPVCEGCHALLQEVSP